MKFALFVAWVKYSSVILGYLLLLLGTLPSVVNDLSMDR
jgi:hypothetical protein